MSVLIENSAAGVKWDLSDLYKGVNDPQIEKDLEKARSQAEDFERKYRTALQPGIPANDLYACIREFEILSELCDKPLIYASLIHAAQTDNPEHGALLTRTREARTSIYKHLIFFDLAWVALDDETAHQLMKDPALSKYRHYLEVKRQYKPHYLSEPEEKILDEKSNTGKAAFMRLFDETIASLKFPWLETTLNLQQILAKLYDADRNIRQSAAETITQVLDSQSRLLTYILNTLLADHHSDTSLRKYPNVMRARHMANEITEASVDALMTSVERFYPTVHRYYRLKARLLNLPELCDYDRYAPIQFPLPSCDWPTARSIVQKSYSTFSTEAGIVIEQFFTKNWIDAEVRDGKRGGAFSSSGVPSAHPFILMSFTDKLRDVMTLAHELGHGLHQYLSRGVGYFQCDTPLTTAETASVFGEMLTFQELMNQYSDPKTRLALLCSKIEDAFATVFRQVVLTRFEQSAHAARQKEGELTPGRINDLWMTANAPMHGDAITLTPGYANWWLYIGHFIHSPFYCYAYSFGELLVLALVEQYKKQGSAFVPKYLNLLSSGGSLSPTDLLKGLDINLNDPQFWEQGLKLLDAMVIEAEELQKKC